MDVKTLISEGGPYSFLHFWGHKPTPWHITKACLSQWYECVFTVGEDIYSSAEQFMMAEKARLMGDRETRALIMNTDDPREIKKLGRKVRNFDSRLWDSHKFDIVVNGNYHKFSQNPELRDFLVSTAGKVLVEASPYDDIWGIGLEASHPDASDPSKWKGTNLLGFALMQVRDMLMQI